VKRLLFRKNFTAAFDWVIENLLKNPLDAMEGKGKIDVSIKDELSSVIIDVLPIMVKG